MTTDNVQTTFMLVQTILLVLILWNVAAIFLLKK